MEPEIRYCTTTDGVRIAYSITGTGHTLLWAPDLPNSHVLLEWRQPGIRNELEGLAEHFRLVRFDARGLGLSDRDVQDLSLEARLRDLDAVVNECITAPFALMGVEWSGPLVATYAARHPDRLTHLILLDTFARGAEFAENPRSKISMEMLERDWEMFVDTRIALGVGLGTGEASSYRDFYRASVTQRTAIALFPELAKDDAHDLLGAIETPTLIIHHTDIQTRTVDVARTLASGITASQMVVIDGSYFSDVPRVVSTISRFIKPVGSGVALPSGTAVILFADIADSTALTERMGDAAFRARARELDAAMRAAVREHGGAVIDAKTLGDGILATFPAASQAISAALACGAAGEAHGLPLHLGLHAGDVLREQNNIFGGAVNIASRISALSAPGEVLVSDIVRGLARTSAGVVFEDRGEHELKGVADAQRVFAVRRDS